MCPESANLTTARRIASNRVFCRPKATKTDAQSRPALETSAPSRPQRSPKSTKRPGGRLVEPRPPAKTDPSEEKPSPFRTSAADAGDYFFPGASPPSGRAIERAHRIPDANSSPFSTTPAAQPAGRRNFLRGAERFRVGGRRFPMLQLAEWRSG